MTVVTKLDERRSRTKLPQDSDEYRRRMRRRIAYDAGFGRGVQERYGFNVQPFKQRNKRLARLRWSAIFLIGVVNWSVCVAAFWIVLSSR